MAIAPTRPKKSTPFHFFSLYLFLYISFICQTSSKQNRKIFFLIYRCSLLFVKLHQSKIERKYFLFYQCSLKFKLINEKKNKCKGKKLNKQTFLLKRKKNMIAFQSLRSSNSLYNNVFFLIKTSV